MTYLELGPTEQFLKSEKDRLTTEIDKASDGFSTWRGSWDAVQWYQKHPGSNGLTYYLGQCDVPKKQKQIKAIDFLLSNP